jgi:hypothetical protein
MPIVVVDATSVVALFASTHADNDNSMIGTPSQDVANLDHPKDLQYAKIDTREGKQRCWYPCGVVVLKETAVLMVK